MCGQSLSVKQNLSLVRLLGSQALGKLTFVWEVLRVKLKLLGSQALGKLTFVWKVLRVKLKLLGSQALGKLIFRSEERRVGKEC